MKLKYRNDRDKSYGAAGMSIAVVLCDADDMLSAVNIDAPADAVMEYSQEYYFSGNPSLSAKTAWNSMLRNFNLAVNVSLGNILCRAQVMDGRNISRELYETVKQAVVEDGLDECGLEKDEIEHMFDKSFSYLQRIFAHRGVQGVAHEFASSLLESRRLSRYEIMERLQRLSML